MLHLNTGVCAELIAAHSDTRHMLEDSETNAIFHWMLRSLITDDWLIDGEVNMTEVAEWSIFECPRVNADDVDVWNSDSGGVWDAAYCYASWLEME